jgi:MFS superfamily sulfate permease-like transporter
MHAKPLNIVLLANLIFTVLIAHFTPELVNSIKKWTFYIYGILMAISAAVFIVWVPETKNLDDQQIKKLFGIIESQKDYEQLADTKNGTEQTLIK